MVISSPGHGVRTCEICKLPQQTEVSSPARTKDLHVYNYAGFCHISRDPKRAYLADCARVIREHARKSLATSFTLVIFFRLFLPDLLLYFLNVFSNKTTNPPFSGKESDRAGQDFRCYGVQ